LRVEYLFKYPKIRKAIWWLSVDLYYKTIYEVLKKESVDIIFDIISPIPCTHFADCFYAVKHLELFSIPGIMPLRSYIHPKLIKQAKVGANTPKANYVTFNPKKEFEYTEQVIRYCLKRESFDISFVPLMNLSYDEIAHIYASAKLHIDFGPFPGREYIPREAAINDMCVITGKRGASKYHEDVPVPEKYKFEAKSENIPEIAKTIKDCVYNYDVHVNDFLEYKNFALGLERTFEKDILDIFNKI